MLKFVDPRGNDATVIEPYTLSKDLKSQQEVEQRANRLAHPHRHRKYALVGGARPLYKLCEGGEGLRSDGALPPRAEWRGEER